MSKRYEHFNTRARAIETIRSYEELSCAVQKKNRSPGPYTIILIFDRFRDTYSEQKSQLKSITGGVSILHKTSHGKIAHSLDGAR